MDRTFVTFPFYKNNLKVKFSLAQSIFHSARTIFRQNVSFAQGGRGRSSQSVHDHIAPIFVPARRRRGKQGRLRVFKIGRALKVEHLYNPDISRWRRWWRWSRRWRRWRCCSARPTWPLPWSRTRLKIRKPRKWKFIISMKRRSNLSINVAWIFV